MLLYFYEPHREKTSFCICKNKDADQLRGTAKLISAFVFATQIVQSLYYLNLKFQASSHLLLCYSPVCVGPGRKPRRPVRHNKAHIIPRFSSYTVCNFIDASLYALPHVVEFLCFNFMVNFSGVQSRSLRAKMGQK